nr:MAG TPA: hypothetical protein [Caudoviricetes sp.]
MRGWLFLFHAPAFLRAEHCIFLLPVLLSETRKGVNLW